MIASHQESSFLINETSFVLLYNNNWERIYALFFKGTGDREQAKELTQNIFKSIWERRDHIVINGRPEYYLLGAAKLQLINHYRDTKIRENHQTAFYAGYCDFDNCTEQQVLFNDLDKEVNLLVDKLPCQCKMVYQLSCTQHLSNKEVAEKLQISLKTVEYHLSNARKLLKRNLADFI